MRAQAHQLQHVCSRLPVNQNKVGLDVAVTMIFPLPCERVIAIFFGHWLVIRQSRDDGDEITLKGLSVWAFRLALQVSLELARLLNRPHQAPLGARQALQFPDCHDVLLSSLRW